MNVFVQLPVQLPAPMGDGFTWVTTDVPHLAKPVPCPFCRSTDIETMRGAHDETYDSCQNCGARGPKLIAAWSTSTKDAKKTRRLWNARSKSTFAQAVSKSKPK